MPRKTPTTLVISFKKPAGVQHAELRQFIIEALEIFGGARHPDDPLFHSLKDVRVSKPVVPWREPAKPAKPLRLIR